MSEEILFRLIYKGKVVGWEYHVSGEIGHTEELWIAKCGLGDMVLPAFDIGHGGPYIKHDRKDRYVMEVDGVKLFERDEVEVLGTRRVHRGVVKYADDATWRLYLTEEGSYHATGIWCLSQHKEDCFKITGIQGVKQ